MKRKKENSSNQSEEENEPCPSYGSKSYWEKRYAANDVDDAKSSSAINGRDEVEQGTSGGFAWYFNYQELKPLLLPLCIGRTDDDDNWSDADENEELFVEDEEESYAAPKPNDEEERGQNIEEHQEDEDPESMEELQTEDTDLGCEEDVCDSEDGPDDEIFQLSCSPKSVIEIGCGDVPLGSGLCENILFIQDKTGVDAMKAVRRIVCFDYSETVIDALLKKQQEEESQSKSRLSVEYKVHDARDLPYSDREFHVVIDKGTLDAMLSHKEDGKDNCIKILSESARILEENGYILIVSHLNANTLEGLTWTQEVLVPGLKGGDSTSDWRIEVHGNDVDNDNETSETEDDSDEKHAGPAVYIIRKIAVSNEEREEREKTQKDSNVDMKFFDY